MQAQSRVLAGNALTELALADEPGERRQNLLRRAAEQFEAAVRAHADLNDEFHRATALNYQGVSYYYARNEQQARASYDDALRAFRTLGERASIVMVLQNLALLNAEAGDYQSAAATYDELLRAQVFDRHGYADMLHNSAIAELELGNVERAIRRHEQSREILRALGDQSGEARALHGLAMAFRTLGDARYALPLAEAAYEIRKRGGERRFIFQSMQALGGIYREIGDAQRALRLHNEAATYADSDSAKVRIALELARSEALGERTQGLAELLAAPIDRLARASLLRAAAEMHLGAALAEDGADLVAARERLERAKSAFAQIGAPILLAESLNRLGRLEARAKAPAEAGARASEALAITRRARAGQSATVKLKLAALDRAALELRIESFMTLAERAGASTLRGVDVQQALEALNGSRNVVLDEFARERVRLTAMNEAQLAEHRLLIEQITGKQFRSQQLLHRLDPPTEEYGELQRDLALLQARLVQLSTPLQGDPAQQRPVQQQRSPLTVSYFLGENGSWAWVQRDGSVTAHRLGARSDIRRAAQTLNMTLRGSAAGRGEEWQSAAKELSELILAPLGSMHHTRIRLVPDDVLHSVPFALLPTPSGQLLIETAESVLGPELGADPVSAGVALGAPGHALIVADPVFSLADARFPPRRPSENVRKQKAAHGPLVGFAEMRLPRLIGARSESQVLSEQFDREHRTVLEGFDASIAALRALERKRYAVVHFATHSFVDTDDYRLSGLALSHFDRDGGMVAGWLRTEDILALGLSADLVVLSGCETAMGEDVLGQGLAGLSQAFIANGSRGIIATHWPLPDASGARIMSEVYTRLRAGASPAAALRTAQLASRADPRTRHPRHWAGLMLLSAE